MASVYSLTRSFLIFGADLTLSRLNGLRTLTGLPLGFRLGILACDFLGITYPSTGSAIALVSAVLPELARNPRSLVQAYAVGPHYLVAGPLTAPSFPLPVGLPVVLAGVLAVSSATYKLAVNPLGMYCTDYRPA